MLVLVNWTAQLMSSGFGKLHAALKKLAAIGSTKSAAEQILTSLIQHSACTISSTKASHKRQVLTVLFWTMAADFVMEHGQDIQQTQEIQALPSSLLVQARRNTLIQSYTQSIQRLCRLKQICAQLAYIMTAKTLANF